MSDLSPVVEVDDEYFSMEAREYGKQVGEEALAEAAGFTRDQLEREYADAVAIAAYYTKLESRISAVPRMSFDAIRQALLQIRADELLDQAASVEEQGGSVSNFVTVRTAPLLTLLSRCMLMVGGVTSEAEQVHRRRTG